MIVEAVIALCVFGAGTGLGLALRKRGAPAKASPLKPSTAGGPKPTQDGAFAVDGVLLYGNEEFWLSGVVNLLDDPNPLAVFCAPHGGSHAWLLAPRSAHDGPALMHPESRMPQGRAPDELTIDNVRYKLDRRAFARAECKGQTPPIADRIRFSLYRAAGDRIALILEPETGDRVAVAGQWLRAGTFDWLPSKS